MTKACDERTPSRDMVITERVEVRERDRDLETLKLRADLTPHFAEEREVEERERGLRRRLSRTESPCNEMLANRARREPCP